MFVAAGAAIEGLPQMKVPITYRPIMQGTGDFAHHGVSSELRETAVKGTIGINEIVELRAPGAVDLHARQLLEFFSFLGGRPDGGIAGKIGLDRHTGIENLQNFGNAAG